MHLISKAILISPGIKNRKFVPGLVVLLSVLFLSSCRSAKNSVCHKDYCVSVDVAQTIAEQEKGLQGRQGLTDKEGMLFIFSSPDRYNFWMQDMQFPIDIVWLDHARRVVHVAANVPPCSTDPCPTYAPEEKSLYVLEIAAGQAQKKGIKSGEVLDFHLNF